MPQNAKITPPSRAGKTRSGIARLKWDSQFFDIPVGEITGSHHSSEELSSLLSYAKEEKYQLVYLEAEPLRLPSQKVLSQFSGRLVDQKMTFFADLREAVLETGGLSEKFRLIENPSLSASSALEALAFQAGTQSRFNNDPRIPRAKFEELYRIWLQRSLTHEIADTVFVIQEISGEMVGFVTLKVRENVGKIGLIAVSQNHRKQGLGQALVTTAHRKMRELKATQAEVVTQGDNTAACHLYRNCGYTRSELKVRYHFWLMS